LPAYEAYSKSGSSCCERREAVSDAEEEEAASLPPHGLRAADRRYPKRDPIVEAMYPGHALPASPDMLEELLWLSLELERSLAHARRLTARVAA
jgi:hypothetical protein